MALKRLRRTRAGGGREPPGRLGTGPRPPGSPPRPYIRVAPLLAVRGLQPVGGGGLVSKTDHALQGAGRGPVECPVGAQMRGDDIHPLAAVLRHAGGRVLGELVRGDPKPSAEPEEGVDLEAEAEE